MLLLHSPHTLKWVSLCGLFLCGLFLAGCSYQPDDMPKIAPVSGVVTLDGQPLPEAEILFQPSSGRASTGMTDENGEYTLLFNRNTYGAKVDDHDVSIITNNSINHSAN